MTPGRTEPSRAFAENPRPRAAALGAPPSARRPPSTAPRAARGGQRRRRGTRDGRVGPRAAALAPAGTKGRPTAARAASGARARPEARGRGRERSARASSSRWASPSPRVALERRGANGAILANCARIAAIFRRPRSARGGEVLTGRENSGAAAQGALSQLFFRARAPRSSLTRPAARPQPSSASRRG
jgi:hypothetical protein